MNETDRHSQLSLASRGGGHALFGSQSFLRTTGIIARADYILDRFGLDWQTFFRVQFLEQVSGTRILGNDTSIRSDRSFESQRDLNDFLIIGQKSRRFTERILCQRHAQLGRIGYDVNGKRECRQVHNRLFPARQSLGLPTIRDNLSGVVSEFQVCATRYHLFGCLNIVCVTAIVKGVWPSLLIKLGFPP